MERAERKKVINSAVYETVEEAGFHLKLCDSWRGKVRTQEGFSKEDKEALNLMYFVILAAEMKAQVNYVAIFAMQLKRLIRKSYAWDAKPANKKFLEEKFENFNESLNEYVRKNLTNDTGRSFTDFMKDNFEISKEEQRIYNAAKAIATLIEYEEESFAMAYDDAEEAKNGVFEELNKYMDLDAVKRMNDNEDPLKKLFKKISRARYIFRWQGHSPNVRCSLLTHMLETSVLGWLMAIEKNDFELAKEAGLVGLFHDIPEIWTDDISSPAKDGIVNSKGVTLREVTEKQELIALDEYFYPCLSEHAKKFFKNGIMLEDIKDEEKRDFFKDADYFDADFEAYWNIRAGACDKKYKNVLRRSLRKKRTPAVDKFVRKMNLKITGKIFI